MFSSITQKKVQMSGTSFRRMCKYVTRNLLGTHHDVIENRSIAPAATNSIRYWKGTNVAMSTVTNPQNRTLAVRFPISSSSPPLNLKQQPPHLPLPHPPPPPPPPTRT
jgi:hypothetical protein